MVGSISVNLLTELGIRTEDAECKLMGDKCNLVIFVLIIKVVWVSLLFIHQTIYSEELDNIAIHFTLLSQENETMDGQTLISVS